MADDPTDAHVLAELREHEHHELDERYSYETAHRTEERRAWQALAAARIALRAREADVRRACAADLRQMCAALRVSPFMPTIGGFERLAEAWERGPAQPGEEE